VEAKGLDDDKVSLIQKKNQEKELIRQQNLKLEQAYGGFGEM
jgi:hypothetical protein